jgi:triosephosphate isomerase
MKYIIANWKMNMSLSDLDSWLSQFSKLIEGMSFKNKILLAPSFVHLKTVADFCRVHDLYCCAQDASFQEKGAHTGDVGAFQLKDYCQFCIIGHSERDESRNMVLEKREACLKAEVTPIVCFTKVEEWEQNSEDGVLLAWEDPDNISRGGVYREKNPTEINDAYDYLIQKSPPTPIIYGGSVHRRNVSHLTKIDHLGGVLVGNASLDPQHFLEIISAFE